MGAAVREGADRAGPRGRRRVALTVLLIVGWLVLLPLLWSAFSTLPSPERLEQSRMARIPTLQGFLWVVGKSAAELCAVLVLTWPRAGAYATRLALAALGLLAWFLYSAPMSLSRMEWLHRRWLAFGVLLLLAALALDLLLRIVARPRTR